MASDFLPEDVQERVRAVGAADLLIAVPTHNNAGTIEPIVKTILGGLAKSYAGLRAVLMNCDGGSTDDTPLRFERAAGADQQALLVRHPVPTVRPLFMPDHGIPGYENAYRAVFEVAEALQVGACAVIDGNLKSVSTDWVHLLLAPVMDRGCDFVAPLFRRHKYDGSLTNSVVYPLCRALYGRRMRYQMGGGHGFSGKMVGTYLRKDVWSGSLIHIGLENWLTTVAVAEGFEVCQAFLGAKVQDSKASGAELSVMLAHAVGSVFGLMEDYLSVWEGRKGSTAVPLVGPPVEVGVEPVTVNVGRMVKGFRQGLRDLLPMWELILSVDTLPQVLPLGLLDVEDFRFPDDIWVQVVYDFALAYHDKVVHREHLLKALTPLYLGKTASFILEAKDSDADGVERLIERLCREYEARKSYLVERWR